MSMRLEGVRVLILLATLLCGTSEPYPLQIPVAELEGLVGRDLWETAPLENRQQLDQRLGAPPKGFIWNPTIWHVWKATSMGQPRFVLLFGEDLGLIPGGTSACLRLLDKEGRTLRSWSFQTGWRNVLQSASFEYSPARGNLVVLRTRPVINGRDIAKEYFAFDGDELHFIRIESANGQLTQNEYIYPNFEIGFVPTAQTVDEWGAMLRSNRGAEVLAALVFLGGRHLVERDRQVVEPGRQSRYADLFQRLLADEKIRAQIVNLTRSNDPWIRGAAVLAARGPRERPFN